MSELRHSVGNGRQSRRLMTVQQEVFCPYCGQRTIQESDSSLPYCDKCSRYIFPADTASIPATTPGSQQLVGIRGWLILVAIGVVLNPIFLLFTIISNLSASSEYAWVVDLYPTLGTLNTIEISGSIILLILSSILLFAFFGKRSSAPSLYKWTAVVSIVVQVLLLLVGASLWGELPELALEFVPSAVGSIIASVVWIVYFNVSKRVEATFVH